jgi:glycosyltransferase involved in cell wall biosynthesis
VSKCTENCYFVGDGPELEPLQKIAGEYTNFLGKVGDEDLKKLYSEARGLIFPGWMILV